MMFFVEFSFFLASYGDQRINKDYHQHRLMIEEFRTASYSDYLDQTKNTTNP